MSAVLKPGLGLGQAAALPAPVQAPLVDGSVDGKEWADEQAFAGNHAWEVDRVLMLERSERRAWTVAAVGVAMGCIGVAAVFVQGPLRRVVEIPIVVDRVTGETTIQQRLSEESIPAIESLDKHNLATFVRAREGYNWTFLQRDFDQVARTAVSAVFADYSHQFEGESALHKKLAATEDWRIQIVNVRLAPSGRIGNSGQATVTYDKVTRQVERNLPPVISRHVATVVYSYQPKALVKEGDRIENPLGFVVTAYRSDPEINTAPVGSKP